VKVLADGVEVFDVLIDFERKDRFREVSTSSGLKESGVGKQFSNPYQLCLGPAPAGYELAQGTVVMRLTGDRRCDAWATCRIVRADDAAVCMEFSLQGHDEGGVSPVGLSEAHLQASYRLLATKPTLE
jgi:hypothetical protein